MASPADKNPKRNGFEPQETLKELEGRLNSDDPEIRASGSSALGALFSETGEARRMIPRLLEMLARGHQSKGPDGTKRNQDAVQVIKHLNG
ncbi:hypothetical protein N9A94_08305 [Akkermansiaceae bacterium]|nr:hypothetical protein [Akkermansiaceae bacterium]MDB4538183.1 hypothetical protein [Akkermansiaceae bacterium]MDB4544733.1 hypothetical protein [Akkermansiaceae bacterium]